MLIAQVQVVGVLVVGPVFMFIAVGPPHNVAHHVHVIGDIAV